MNYLRIKSSVIILALSTLTVTAQLSGDRTQVLYSLINGKNYSEGGRMADSLLVQFPADPELFYLSGLCQSNLLKFDQARMAFEASDSLSPDSRSVLSNLVDCYCELNDFRNAEKTVFRVISLDSTNPGGWIQLAKVYTRQSKTDEAIKVYQWLWHADSMNLWYPRQIGTLYSRNDQYFEALPFFELVCAIDSTDIESSLRLGQACLKTKQTGKTMYLDRAIRQDSTLPLLFRFRGALFLLEADLPQAESDLTRAIELDDSTAFTYRHLGISQYLQSFYDRALISFSHAVRKDSLDAEAWYYLGYCHKWNQNIPRAIECMKQALKVAIPPFVGSIYSGLGEMYSMSRDFSTALKNYEKALEFNPDDPVPYAQIGLLTEESYGSKEKAKECYERFIKEYKGGDRHLMDYVKARLTVINEKLFMEGKLKKD
jgi:tetratricopeptide (TPR) repeat protein